ncbi:hypothetical protein QBC39DRAFT_33982 [Podospora conica]|nr:hypothetical protein QBC39DRAFT_33982 [Schizothecium conicum]
MPACRNPRVHSKPGPDCPGGHGHVAISFMDCHHPERPHCLAARRWVSGEDMDIGDKFKGTRCHVPLTVEQLVLESRCPASSEHPASRRPPSSLDPGASPETCSQDGCTPSSAAALLYPVPQGPPYLQPADAGCVSEPAPALPAGPGAEGYWCCAAVGIVSPSGAAHAPPDLDGHADEHVCHGTHGAVLYLLPGPWSNSSPAARPFLTFSLTCCSGLEPMLPAIDLPCPPSPSPLGLFRPSTTSIPRHLARDPAPPCAPG